jgi:hypothetical protein
VIDGLCAVGLTSFLTSNVHKIKLVAHPSIIPDAVAEDLTKKEQDMETKMIEVALPILLILFYMWPSVIAQSRKHNNYNAIVALNILLGWTCLGWIGALVWSLTAARTAAAEGRLFAK